MFVLQTTLAILIAFLAVTAYKTTQAALSRGRLRGKCVEIPGSPQLHSVHDAKAGRDLRPSPPGDGLAPVSRSLADEEAMDRLKQLYHKLHNLEHHPEILPDCRAILVSMLSETLSAAMSDPATTILSIDTFSHGALSHFLTHKDADVTDRWEAYLLGRKSGSPRDMFSNRAEAEWWLKQAAQVKYVDGAWIGHINKVTTPFGLRKITKNAWQVMSEELGDGDLAKNHVHVYRNLMDDIHARLPSADSPDFISPRHGLAELRCWKAAVAQLLISLFPHDFLPEILGFNMAYESLPLHLLKTVKELRELRLNPYYFELHISIDNADSGHAAMAAAAVTEYLRLVADTEGPDAAAGAWKRVQAGYILAEGLPTTPESPSLKSNRAASPVSWTEEEAALLQVFAAKAHVAHKIHCNSRLKIGRRSLVDWLEPTAFAGTQWRRDFMDDLSLCRPWVIKGNSKASRLVKELSWEGKMFGSFTQAEVEIVERWIDSMGHVPQKAGLDGDAYWKFTRQRPGSARESVDVLVDYPCFAAVPEPDGWWSPESDEVGALRAPEIDTSNPDVKYLVPVFFAATSLLESLPSVPTRASDAFGSAVLRVLRAQTGFNDEGPGVAGMDEVRRTDDGEACGLVELGVEICERAGLGTPRTLEEAVGLGSEGGAQAARYMVSISMRWLTHRELLVGLSWGFVELHALLARQADAQSMLSAESRRVLEHLVSRERQGLEACKRQLETQPDTRRRFWAGVAAARSAIARCFPQAGRE